MFGAYKVGPQLVLPGGCDLHRLLRCALGVAVFAGAAGAVRGRGSHALVPPVVAIHRRSKQLPKLDEFDGI